MVEPGLFVRMTKEKKGQLVMHQILYKDQYLKVNKNSSLEIEFYLRFVL